jgi:hypothetical protein
MANLFSVETQGLEAKLKKLGPKIRTATLKSAEKNLDEFGRIYVQTLQSNVPRGDGTTAASFKYKIAGRGTEEMTLTVTGGSPSRPKKLIEWLVFGTGIYGPRHTPIKPKRYKFLKFPGKDGRMVYAKQVRGMKPRNFIKQTNEGMASYRRSLAGKIGRLAVSMIEDSRA